MAETTGINWCDSTFNPWIGCTRVSPACDDCYAARSTPTRTRGIEWGPGKPRQRTAPSNWKLPEKWNREPFYQCQACGWRGDKSAAAPSFDESKPYCCAQCDGDFVPARRRVFCASLSDWLDNEVPIEWLVDLLDLIRRTPNLDWLLLTKRIGNWQKRLEQTHRYAYGVEHIDGALFDWIDAWLMGKPPANVWLGSTVINQDEADRDVPKLLQVPARIRFLSVEPMLGAVDIDNIPHPYRAKGADWVRLQAFARPYGSPGAPGIHWIIGGFETGKDARPGHPDWARGLRDQCEQAGIAFLWKQNGEWREAQPGDEFNTGLGRAQKTPAYIISIDGTVHCHLNDHIVNPLAVVRIGKDRAGNLLDGRQHLEWPA